MMKRFILIALLAGAASGAQAQTAPSPGMEQESTVRIPAPTYSIELPAKPYRITRQEFEPYWRIYSLSNGDEMTFTQRGRRIYASLRGRAEQELVAAARNVFVAKDRNLKATLFLDQSTDEITGEVLIRTQPTLAEAARGEKGQVLRLVAGY